VAFFRGTPLTQRAPPRGTDRAAIPELRSRCRVKGLSPPANPCTRSCATSTSILDSPLRAKPAIAERRFVSRNGGVSRVHEDDQLDEAQFADWVKQASQLPDRATKPSSGTRLGLCNLRPLLNLRLPDRLDSTAPLSFPPPSWENSTYALHQLKMLA